MPNPQIVDVEVEVVDLTVAVSDAGPKVIEVDAYEFPSPVEVVEVVGSAGVPGPPGPAGPAINTNWVLSQFNGNLVSNGFANLGDVTNWDLTVLNKADRPPQVPASFRSANPGTATGCFTAEFIPIDVTRQYVFSMWVRRVVSSPPGNFLAGLVPIDVDKLTISAQYYMYQANTVTTLAAELKNGDTTVTLTSSQFWNNTNATTHMCGFTFWNYVDSTGFAYPPETYTRNVFLDRYVPGAIVGNVITLKAAWNGGTFPVGTKVSNSYSGNQYLYLVSAVPAAETWTQYVIQPMGGRYITNGNGFAIAGAASNGWPHGTAYVKVVVLPGQASATHGWAGVSLEQVPTPDVPNASGAPDNTIGVRGATYLDTATKLTYGPKGTEANIGSPGGLFDAVVPVNTTGTGPYEVGTEFTVKGTGGYITGVRYYRSPTDTQTTRSVKLWDAFTVEQFAIATSTTESGSGWRTISFAQPVYVPPGRYIVSYDVQSGAQRVFTTTGMQLGAPNPYLSYWQGKYSTTPGNWPNNAIASANYFADPVFQPATAWTTASGTASGAGHPDEGLGIPGAAYVDTSTGVLYGPKLANPVDRTATTRNLVNFWRSGTTTSGAASYEFGVRFDTTVPGKIVAIRFMRAGAATETTRNVRLWNAAGQQLALVATSAAQEAGEGWIRVPLPAPTVLGPGRYTASFSVVPGTSYPFYSGTPTYLSYPEIGNAVNMYSSGAAGVMPPSVWANGPLVDVEFVPTTVWPLASIDPARPVQMDAYTIPGAYTWTKPGGATRVVVVCQNGGSGGGSGRRGLTSEIRSGGGGGAGGTWTITEFAAVDLPATVAVNVSAGGAGGAAVAADNTNGTTGSGPTGMSSFAASVRWPATTVSGGGGGQLGGAAAGGSGSLGIAPGGASSATGAVGGAGTWTGPYHAPGGGSGGGLTAGNIASAGATAYTSPLTSNYSGMAGGAATGAPGITSAFLPGTNEPWPWGSGGSGGGASATTAGGAGGNGVRGGGGGGGGASSNGFASGAGGKGGDGFVQVLTYF